MSDSKFEFPTCMHALAAAMHMHGIDPQTITIKIPRDKWWALQCSLERQFRGFLTHDGRTALLDSFRYLGFQFVPDDSVKR